MSGDSYDDKIYFYVFFFSPNMDPPEESILSMKKSAEIAATFSGARINQTTDIVDRGGGGGGSSGSSSSGEDSTDAAYASRRGVSGDGGCCSCGNKRSEVPAARNFKSSLGYFP